MSKEAEAIRIKFYGETDSRSYDEDEIKLMQSYAEEYHKREMEKQNSSPSDYPGTDFLGTPSSH